MKIEDISIGEFVIGLIVVISISLGVAFWLFSRKPVEVERSYNQTPPIIRYYLGNGAQSNINPHQALIRLTEKVQMLEMRIEKLEKNR